MENKKKQTSTVAGLLFVGCIIIGLALGLLLQHVAFGTLIGIGAGFVAMGLTYAFLKQ